MTCKDCIHVNVCNVMYCDIMPRRSIKSCGCFKDKSRFVEIPCKVGDVIYFVHRNHAEVFFETFTVEMIAESKYGWNAYPSLANYTMSFPFDWFGISVFLSREEAEKALEAMNEKTKLF